MIKHRTISFMHAFEGLMLALKTQINFRIHFALSFMAIVGGWFFRISYSEWLTILTLIFVGLAFETTNTAIEETTDAINDEFHPKIKSAKDTAAGAMLVFSIGALFIAGIIFIPKIIALVIVH